VNIFILDACALIAYFGKEEGAETVKKMPIEIIAELRDEIFKKAGYLKAKYKISIADSIAIAETIINTGSLITADHHEIEPVETAKKINMTWFR
jgi:PIN domain nuclease of toxin-antitoxin system